MKRSRDIKFINPESSGNAESTSDLEMPQYIRENEIYEDVTIHQYQKNGFLMHRNFCLISILLLAYTIFQFFMILFFQQMSI